MKIETPPEYLTGAEVLRLLRIDTKTPRQTLLRLRRAGLPAVRVLRRFLYPRADTVAFLRQHVQS
jgi:hypothetical protein